MIRAVAAIDHSPDDGVAGLVASEGSARHRHRLYLVGDAVSDDLADAVHILCHSHGNHPGFVDEAARTAVQPEAVRWLHDAADGFARERALLAKLTAAAGPQPSTACQAETESAIGAQRHAFEMLARSDRAGCATGAIAALMLDWPMIRSILGKAAKRFDIDLPPIALPATQETGILLSTLSLTPASARAITFGARQLLAQHQNLLDLMKARTDARQ